MRLELRSIYPDTFKKYRDTPPICIAILLQKYALSLAETSIYTTNLYHDTAPMSIAILLQKYSGQGSLEHSFRTALKSIAVGPLRAGTSHNTSERKEKSFFFPGSDDYLLAAVLAQVLKEGGT